MEVSCPECSSRFNLPDQLAKPGAKLRCTVCKTVFQLPDVNRQQPPPPPPPDAVPDSVRESPVKTLPNLPPRKSKKKIWISVLLLVLAAGAGYGGWYFYQSESKPPVVEDIEKKVELITMRNVRQYTLPNEKVGKVLVIEGKAVNEFPETRDLIELEAAIYDKDKKPFKVKRQLAGSQLSLFQLQVLSEKEMEAFLNNKMEILANNTSIPPGGEVPFMIVFYAPPDELSEFGVKIADVQTPEKKE